MADAALPDAEVLRQLLDYNPETGDFVWRARPASLFEDGRKTAQCLAASWNSRYAGGPALNASKGNGYKMGRIMGKAALAHRVAWKIHYGDEPDVIDHINRDKADNRIANLRSVSQRLNCRNGKMRKNNSSGVTGVGFDASRPNTPWTVQISGRHKGRFKTKPEAVAARRLAEDELGYHRR